MKYECYDYNEKFTIPKECGVTYIYEKNQGQGHARNEALKLVTTPYVAFLDSDDWLMPDFVEKLMPLADVDMIFTLPEIYDEMAHVWHVFVVRTQERERLQKYLEENGIQTNIHYPTPPHHQLAYQEYKDMSFPITEQIHAQVLSLPISPVLTDEEVKKVIEVLNEWK